MLKIYNTLKRSVEQFTPISTQAVGMYTCGPTVYDFQHIGHMRRYVGDDILVRVLKLNGYKVKQVMNITDVGHLVSDADTGEDKMEKGARKFGESVWDIAKKFEKQFLDSSVKLNIQKPQEIMHATDYIDEQIQLITILQEKGYTYKTEDGIYFDTAKVADYTKLSHQNIEGQEAGVRVSMGEKKNISDFALWKFSYLSGRSFDFAQDDAGIRRQMEWESPWGLGFPGWHIECSAMSMKALGQTLDIHTGGIDHIAIHHTNEIAQSEGATGKEFVRYWVHHAFLMVEGEKMSKSIGNIFTVQDVIDKGFDPLALRYLYLQTHYRQEMNFTWDALGAAAQAYQRLRKEVVALGEKGKEGSQTFEDAFLAAVNDDMNMAKAMAIVWDFIKSNESPQVIAASMAKVDAVLGLNLTKPIVEQVIDIPQDIQDLAKQREELRKMGSFHAADHLRTEVKKMGYEILDNTDGTTTIKKI